MKLENRIRKIENIFMSLQKDNYNIVIIVELTNEPGIWEVGRSGEPVFEGTKDEIEGFLKPYCAGGSVIIWDDIPGLCSKTIERGCFIIRR